MSAKGIEEDTETLNTSYADRLAELILQKWLYYQMQCQFNAITTKALMPQGGSIQLP